MTMVELERTVVAAAVRIGDDVCVSARTGFCVVTDVQIDDDGRVRILYIKHGEDAWSKGWQHTSWLVERGIGPFPVDRVMRVRPGARERADQLRLEMEQEQETRLEAKLAKAEERERQDLADLIAQERNELQSDPSRRGMARARLS